MSLLCLNLTSYISNFFSSWKPHGFVGLASMLRVQQPYHNLCKVRMPVKTFFLWSWRKCYLHSCVDSLALKFPHGNRDLTYIQNVSLMLCPHKVTKSQCHLAEKNNRHTPKIFMGYCTGTAAFRDLLSSILAQSSVLNTDPSAPSLLCIPALKRMGHSPPLYWCEWVETAGDRELQEAAKKERPWIWLHCPQGSRCHAAPVPAERKAGLPWLSCLSKAHTRLLCRDYSTGQGKGGACLHPRKTHIQVLLQHITALLFTLTPE